MASQHYLIVALPGEEPISYTITGDKMTLGRSPDNDIQVLVHEVSTKHCEFSSVAGGYQIIDVGSSNGTRVKGQSITNGRVFLNHRDTILLGETVSAYFVTVDENEEVDPKATIESIENGEEEKKEEEPAKPKLPTFKAAKPLKAPTAVSDEQSGASTVKLQKLPSPAKKAVPSLKPPSVKKEAPAAEKSAEPSKAITPKKLTAPNAEKSEPAAEPKSVAETPKLAVPEAVKKVPKLNQPGTSDGGGSVPKLATPGGEAAKKIPQLQKPEGAKKVPKLNIPKKED